MGEIVSAARRAANAILVEALSWRWKYA